MSDRSRAPPQVSVFGTSPLKVRMEQIHERSNVARHGVVEGTLQVVRFEHALRYTRLSSQMSQKAVGSGVDGGTAGRPRPRVGPVLADVIPAGDTWRLSCARPNPPLRPRPYGRVEMVRRRQLPRSRHRPRPLVPLHPKNSRTISPPTDHTAQRANIPSPPHQDFVSCAVSTSSKCRTGCSNFSNHRSVRDKRLRTGARR